MNELDDTFDQYLEKIDSDQHRKQMREILVKTFLHLELPAKPEIYHKIPSFFLYDQPIIGFEALKEAIAVYPGNEVLENFTNIEFKVVDHALHIPWDQSFPFTIIKEFIKFNEALILDGQEGIDYAED